jgi:hypothetical protein
VLMYHAAQECRVQDGLEVLVKYQCLKDITLLSAFT